MEPFTPPENETLIANRILDMEYSIPGNFVGKLRDYLIMNGDVDIPIGDLTVTRTQLENADIPIINRSGKDYVSLVAVAETADFDWQAARRRRERPKGEDRLR